MESQQASLREQIHCLKKFYKKELPDTKSSVISSIIFNLIFWIYLILIIINPTKGDNNDEINGIFYLLLILGIISYLIYIRIELCSTSFILLSIKDEKIIKEKMGDFFKAKPSIWLYISCYHNNKNYNSRDGGSPIIYTYKQELKYNYNLWRDISGKINLNINNYKCKYYSILKVIQEVIIIIQETLDDYNSYK